MKKLIQLQIQRMPALTARVNCFVAVNQGGTAEPFGPYGDLKGFFYNTLLQYSKLCQHDALGIKIYVINKQALYKL